MIYDEKVIFFIVELSFTLGREYILVVILDEQSFHALFLQRLTRKNSFQGGKVAKYPCPIRGWIGDWQLQYILKKRLVANCWALVIEDRPNQREVEEERDLTFYRAGWEGSICLLKDSCFGFEVLESNIIVTERQEILRPWMGI